MRRPNIVNAIKKGLDALPLDILIPLNKPRQPLHSYYRKYYSQLFKERQTGDYEDLFNHDRESVADLYPKAKEPVAAIKEKVNLWLTENKA